MTRIVSNEQNVVRLFRTNSWSRASEAWQLWHVWTVTIPRRSITGRLVWGTVMRRRDDGRWIYKKYVERAE
jgi:hypothetical protein